LQLLEEVLQLARLSMNCPTYDHASREIRNSIRIIASADVPGESSSSVMFFLTCLGLGFQRLFNRKLSIKVFHIDFSRSEVAGIREWVKSIDRNPQHGAYTVVKIITDYPHLARALQEKHTNKFKGTAAELTKFIELYAGGVRMLHMCPTLACARRLWELIRQLWISMGQEDIADWFNQYIMCAPYWNFQFNASGEPGLTPSQQALESNNRLAPHHPAAYICWHFRVLLHQEDLVL